jgi:hypothetical protein
MEKRKNSKSHSLKFYFDFVCSIDHRFELSRMRYLHFMDNSDLKVRIAPEQTCFNDRLIANLDVLTWASFRIRVQPENIDGTSQPKRQGNEK